MSLYALAAWALSLPVGHYVEINGDAMCAVVWCGSSPVAVVELA